MPNQCAVYLKLMIKFLKIHEQNKEKNIYTRTYKEFKNLMSRGKL